MKRHKGKMHDYLYNFQLSWWNQVDPDAKAFNDATGTEFAAINTLVLNLKSSGAWSKLTNIYPLVGTSATANAVNLKSPGTNNITMTGTETHNAQGINTNNASGTTFVAPIIVSTERLFYMGMYTTTSDPSLTTVDLNCLEVPAAALYIRYSDGICYPEFFSSASTPAIASTAVGLTHYNRDPNTTSAKLYLNGTLLRERTYGSASGLSASTWQIGNPSSRTYGFIMMGETMTTEQILSISNAVNTYCTAMGR